MGRGLGKLQRKILQYAEEKIAKTDPAKLRTVRPYFRARETAEHLGVTTENVLFAIQGLQKRGLLRIFPNRRLRGRSFGSVKLPEVTLLPSTVEILRLSKVTIQHLTKS